MSIDAKAAIALTARARENGRALAAKKLPDCMKKIDELIIAACSNGDSSCESQTFDDEYLSEMVFEELERLGFDVSDESETDGSPPFEYHIGWTLAK